MSDRVHIVLAADANYRNGLEVTRRSIIAACPTPERLVFHVFTDADLAKLDVSLFGGWNNGSKMNYLRLFLPRILDLDRVVYSDVDTVWMRDVCELWDATAISASERSICWVPDFESTAAGRPNYGCDGVMVMNLARLRAFDLIGKARNWVSVHGTPAFVDQDILNTLLGDDVQLLPNEWNVMGNWRRLPPIGTPCVFHITGIGLHFRDTPIAWPPQDVLWFRAAERFGVCPSERPWRRRWAFPVIALLAALWPFRGIFVTVLRGRLREKVMRHLYFARVVAHEGRGNPWMTTIARR